MLRSHGWLLSWGASYSGKSCVFQMGISDVARRDRGCSDGGKKWRMCF